MEFVLRSIKGYQRSDKTKSRLAHRRLSQKTNKRICFLFFFAFHSKQNKIVCSFLEESTVRQSAFGFI